MGVIPDDWEVKSLNRIGETYSGMSGKVKADFGHGNACYIPFMNIMSNSIIDTTYFKKVDIKSIENQIKVQKEDLFFNTSSETPEEVGMSSVLKEDIPNLYLNSFCFGFRLKKDLNTNGLWLSYFFRSGTGRKLIYSLAQGATRYNLSKTNFLKLKISYPRPEEQTAIANILSDNDTLIEKLEKLIAKKKAIKQGAMQVLLTGKKRLPGFSEDWEVKRLGEICDIKKGQLITERTRVDGSIPVIAGGKESAYSHNKSNRNGNTITISGSGANAGYVAFHDTPIFASDCSTIEESRIYSIEYIYFLLKLLQEKIYKMQTGGAQPHVHPSDLNPLMILIPKMKEQTAIAKILSNMDKEIESLEKKLKKYKKIKVGMMQQLLTGKIRIYEPAEQ